MTARARGRKGEPMKILLIQVDGKMPNLALMKLSAYHKAQGDRVHLGSAINPDIVYLSCIFEKNYGRARSAAMFYPEAKTVFGGPGLGIPTALPPEVDHIMPDYDLFGIKYSMGYTSRGCFRNCPFCIVPKLEGEFRENAAIAEFHHPDHRKIMIMDNAFLTSRRYGDKLLYLIENDLMVNFLQGLDARIITRNVAHALSKVRSYNPKFREKRFCVAWDLMKNSDAIIKGMENMIGAGIPPGHIMVYTLVGFNTTHEQDMYRFKELEKLGVDPYIMVYNGIKQNRKTKDFARWVNQRRYKVCSFAEYDHNR